MTEPWDRDTYCEPPDWWFEEAYYGPAYRSAEDLLSQEATEEVAAGE